jgi:hypothetical protein
MQILPENKIDTLRKRCWINQDPARYSREERSTYRTSGVVLPHAWRAPALVTLMVISVTMVDMEPETHRTMLR